MDLIPEIVAEAGQLAAIRRAIHADPEVGFEESRTADLVAERLTAWGVDEVHRRIGGTGVVGILRGRRAGRRIGLRADMDALPMQEETGLPHASRNPGAFHGCGHDGHTTMLLGAAHYLARSRDFDGEIVLIFQPAEETLSGAAAMIADGLFRRFPCDEIYALHNWPNAPLGRITVRRGVAMAASDSFQITVRGRGAHGAQPHHAVDPVMATVAIAQAMQTIVSRNIDPLHPAIVSITRVHAGSAFNVIPESATLGGTIRSFDEATRTLIIARMTDLARGIAAGFGAEAETVLRPGGCQALRNSDRHAEAALAIARELVGSDLTAFADEPVTGSEDFADMLAVVPGAYLFLGQGEGPSLHNPRYDFNDDVTPVGASLLARLGARRAGGPAFD